MVILFLAAQSRGSWRAFLVRGLKGKVNGCYWAGRIVGYEEGDPSTNSRSPIRFTYPLKHTASAHSLQPPVQAACHSFDVLSGLEFACLLNLLHVS